MDYTQIKKDVKSLLKENRSGIRKEMWKILSVYWVFILVYASVMFFVLPRDIDKTQPAYYIISYLLGFITSPARFIFSVTLFRALYLFLPGETFPGSNASGRLLNGAILFRCIILGLLQHILAIPNTLVKYIPLAMPAADTPSNRLGLMMLQLFIMVISIIFFSIFLPCFLAQGCTIPDSFKSAVKLIIRLREIIRFYLRVLLPVNIFLFCVTLLFLVPLYFFDGYYDKLFFMTIFSALTSIAGAAFTTGIWMKLPYYNLCVMEYVDINQCVLQLSEDAVAEYSEEDIELRTERLENLQQIRGHMQNTSVAVGKSVCICLKSDGTVLAFDMIKKKEYVLDNWKNIRAVAAGGDKIFGIKNDGTAVMTDTGRMGTVTELKNETEEDEPCLWQDIVELGAGEEHMAALNSGGEVVAAGDNKYDQCEVKKWKDITKIAVGSWHTVGLKKDGTVVAEGLNEDGQCNVSKWADIYSIAAGGWHTVGLKTGGAVIAAGLFEDGQCNVSKWVDIAAVDCGKTFTVGLMVDGTVIATSGTESGQGNVSGWCNIVAVFAGDDCAAGLKSDGTAVFTKLSDTAEDIGFPFWTDIKVST